MYQMQGVLRASSAIELNAYFKNGLNDFAAQMSFKIFHENLNKSERVIMFTYNLVFICDFCQTVSSTNHENAKQHTHF